MKPAILYLTYDGLTDPLGQSQVLPYLCGLSSHYAISIISFEKPARFKESENGIAKICNQHNIRWHPLRYHKSPPVLATLFDIGKLWFKAKQLYKRDGVSVVHCRSYITALVGLWMKREYNVKFIFDMRGFWADERVEGGLWNLKNPLFKVIYTFFKKKEKTFLDQADYTVVLTHTASLQLTDWRIKSPVKIIPCCVDLNFFDRSKLNVQHQQDLRNQLEIKDNDYVVCYIGSLGTWYMYDEMVLFFDHLKKVCPTARMLFLTPDVHRVGQREDFIIKSISRVEVPAYLAICNASICFVRPTFSKKGSSATKMAEAMAMGIPLIVNSGWGDVEEVVEDAASGIIIRKFDETELAQAAKRLLSGDFKEDTIRKAALNYFSLDEGIKRYHEIYDELLESI